MQHQPESGLKTTSKDTRTTQKTRSLNNVENPRESNPQMKMLLKCKSCGKIFNSTFTAEDFETIPAEQYEAGTLHLCPHCGALSTYLLKDYFEAN